MLSGLLGVAAAAPGSPFSSTSIFAPASTPAKTIFGLSMFVLAVTAAIFLVVAGLLAYSIVKFRDRSSDADREPAQVYGSTQIELAWTVIPVLIVAVLFLATARVIHAVQDAPKPPAALDGLAIGAGARIYFDRRRLANQRVGDCIGSGPGRCGLCWDLMV